MIDLSLKYFEMAEGEYKKAEKHYPEMLKCQDAVEKAYDLLTISATNVILKLLREKGYNAPKEVHERMYLEDSRDVYGKVKLLVKKDPRVRETYEKYINIRSRSSWIEYWGTDRVKETIDRTGELIDEVEEFLGDPEPRMKKSLKRAGEFYQEALSDYEAARKERERISPWLLVQRYLLPAQQQLCGAFIDSKFGRNSSKEAKETHKRLFGELEVINEHLYDRDTYEDFTFRDVKKLLKCFEQSMRLVREKLK
ncbi:MAG: hypothetical protein L6243_04920 [Candidatus Altiarchaeales archaeon]|nr:hypothetical protein [Candidatus Altiarchaeota archaeon]MCG2782912.1 hypothetical protein [Candidatus Altiarchaeales archaeon]